MQGANFGYGIGPVSPLGPRPGPGPPPCTGADSMTRMGQGDLALPAGRGGLPGPRQPESRRDWRIAVETAGLRDRIGWRIRLVEGEPVVPGPRRLAAKSVLQVHWPSVPQAHGPSVPRLTGRQFPGPTGRQFPRLTGHHFPPGPAGHQFPGLTGRQSAGLTGQAMCCQCPWLTGRQISSCRQPRGGSRAWVSTCLPSGMPL